MEIIAKLSDTPNVDDGLTAAQLKDKFDEGGKALKEYINNVLLVEALERPKFLGLVKSNGREFVQAQAGVDYLAELANGSVTKAKLGSDVTAEALGGAVPARALTVSLSGWTNKAVTVSAAEVTGDNHVIVTPHPDSHVLWCECMVRATAQGNGSLTFACEDVPGSTIKANVLIVG